MFCPNCGDCRGKLNCISFNKSGAFTMRCPICGHCFSYKTLPYLEKKLGEGNGFMFDEDNTVGEVVEDE